MTAIITEESINASYPPLRVTEVPKPSTTWLNKALRDSIKPSRGSRITAGKLAELIPESIASHEVMLKVVAIPKPLVYVSYTRTVYFLWEDGENYLEIGCLERGKLTYEGTCGWSKVGGTEKLGDKLPQVIEFWLQRLYA